MSSPPADTPLARLFADILDASHAGCGIDDSELADMITRSGLVEWQAVSEDALRISGLGPTVGYMRLVLTEEGRRVLQGRSGRADEGYPVAVAKSWVDQVSEKFAYAHMEQLYRPLFVPSDSFRGRAEAVARLIEVAVTEIEWRTTAEFDRLVVLLLPQARRLMPKLSDQTLQIVMSDLVLNRTLQETSAAARREYDEEMDRRDADDAAAR